MQGRTNTKNKLPRGIRNNNPGNIRHSSAMWKGKADNQQDASFVIFEKPEYGIRAIARILLNYQKKYKLDTIEEIINRWAPPCENNTNAYVSAVARAAGVKKDDSINLSNNQNLFRVIITSIIDHENGSPMQYGFSEWYDLKTVTSGLLMANSHAPKIVDRSEQHLFSPTLAVLKLGQKGPEVGLLQKHLNAKGANLKVDNDFGGKTETAVKEFQQNNGLVVDGKAGKNTRKALGMHQTGPMLLNLLVRKSDTAVA